VEMQPGEVFSVQMGGGGGYGPPVERDEDRVRQDVVAGKVSPQRARDVYGVVIDPASGTVDAAATRAARAALAPRTT